MNRLRWFVMLPLWAMTACSDPARPSGPVLHDIFVDSDPRGAAITLDGAATARVTPDTLRSVTDADHDITATITKATINYATTLHVTAGAIPASVLIPVVARCVS